MPEDDGILAAHYRIDPGSAPAPLPSGFRVHSVIDRRDPNQKLIAIEAKPDHPFRPRLTFARGGAPVPNAVLPVDYGCGRDLTGRVGWFVIGEAPPGAPLGLTRAWRESELIAYVLTPAAAALAGLQARGLTHRAINPDNLFRAGSRDPITLGPFWAAPPASLQPALFEPPYMARCLPKARGEGSIADDVYALGVTLLALVLGKLPLADLDDASILRRKLELGSFTALTNDLALPPLLADLLRGMLAEDPDHRSSPALLARPEQARARRVAARPPRRAQVSLEIAGQRVWSARDLALALGMFPDRGFHLLRTGEVERWLRRCLGDPQLGMRVEEVTRRFESGGLEDPRSANIVVMRCVAAIDPLGPLVWRGFAVQPDGIGPALAGATPEELIALQEIIGADAVTLFCAGPHRRQGQPDLKEDQREWRAWLSARGPAGGVKRLAYGMNPLMACASPLLSNRPVVRVADLLPALDEAASTADRSRPPIDSHIAAFIAARGDAPLAGDMPTLASFAEPAERLAVLRLFGRLQVRISPGPLPGLASWIVACGLVGVQDWRSLKTRAALQDRLLQAAAAGSITTIVELVDNEPARDADKQGAEGAAARVHMLEDALRRIDADEPGRDAAAQRLGREMVTGVGLIATILAAVALALQ